MPCATDENAATPRSASSESSFVDSAGVACQDRKSGGAQAQPENQDNEWRVREEPPITRCSVRS